MRQLILSIIISCFCFQAFCSGETKPPKVAVVLSGGGAKGFAHIGVLKVLEEEGIPVDIVVGTSMGSIVGGLYSIGFSADSIAQLARSENWQELLSDKIPRKELDQFSRMEQQRYLLKFPVKEGNKPGIPNGMINGQNIINLFCGLTANLPENADFTHFPDAFACIATDLETGEEVILNSGFLPTAMFSSMAIPGVFVPGEHNGRMLIDGGLVNNFPADVAKMMGADIIIGVDVSEGLHSGDEIESIDKVMDQLINFYVLKKNSSNRALCNIIIHPDTRGYNVSSFNTPAVDTLIDRGIAAAKKDIGEIRKLKSDFDLQSRKTDSTYISNDKWQISDISLSGKFSMSENSIENAIGLDIPEIYSYNDIKKAINNLYGTDNFKRVYFNLRDNHNGKELNINLVEDKKWDVNVGMRLNSTDAVSIVLNSTRKDYTKTFGLLSFSADISSNPRLNMLIELDKKDMAKLSLEINGMYKALDIHFDRNNSYKTDLFVASAKLFFSRRAGENTITGSGFKQNYYNGKLYSIVSDSTRITTNEKSISDFFVFVKYDNLDNYYFPKKGSEVYSEIAMAPDKGLENINTVILLRMRNIIRLSNSFSALISFYGRSLLSESTPGQLGNFAGGHDYEISLDNNLPFYGLPSVYPTDRQTFVGLAGLRFSPAVNHYITAVSNYLLDANEIYPLKKFRTISGFGLTYSYCSVIGPVELTAGYSGKYKSPALSANIGFWF